MLGLVGCSDQRSQPKRHPGDDVLKDPMGYKPAMEDPNISGGGLFRFDKKAFDKDLNSVGNP